MRLCEEACEERLASLMRKPKVVTKGKNIKRKQESADGASVTKSNAKAKKNSTNSHSNSNSNDSNSTEIKRRKVEKPVESKVEEIDTSKDDVTIFLSNLDYR